MSNLGIGLLILSFPVLGLPVTVMSVVNRKESETSVWFMSLCAANGVWAVLHALEYLLASESAAIFMHCLKIAVIGASAIFLYHVVLSVTRRKKPKARGVICMAFFPMCTLLAVLADRYFDAGLLLKDMRIDTQGGVRVFAAFSGVWFWLHCAFCYALLAVSLFMLLRHFSKMPNKYKTTSGVMLAGISLSAAMTIVAITGLFPRNFDAGDLAAILSQVFYYFAVYHPQSVDLLMSSREVVFEMADHPILVLDKNDEIVDFNGYAGKVAAESGVSRLKGVGYDVFFKRWTESAAAHTFEDDPAIFTIHNSAVDTHFEVDRRDIYSPSGRRLGAHVEIKNITPAMTLVHRLQAAAYFDNLTGIRNRNSFIQTCEHLDKAESFPLGVLVGDLNNLKPVNDKMGHALGDLMLQVTARAFEECKPHGATAFRVGGDEFLALTPGTDAAAMERYIADIRGACQKAGEENGFPISIALGYILKTNFDDTIQETVRRADAEMYRDKQQERRKR